MVALANFYLRGELGNAATDRAEIWLRAAAETGDAEAQFQLGALYASRSGASSDTAAALRYYRQAAEQGHSSAQHNCAEMLLASGHGRAAAVWFTAAAAQGVAESQLMLGDLYATSRGVPRNLQIARDWYEKAASNGLRSAVAKLERCARLLDMLADPRFAGIDDSTLARTVCSVLMEETSVTQEKEGPWYRIAAEAGDAEAQSILAWALLTGDGCDADAVSSFSWFKRSAEAGFVPAQLQLGIMYRDGVGVPADEDLSSSWIKRAAEAGNDEARALLEPASGAAGAGAEGEPAVVEVPWYRISAEEGDAEAQSILAWACLTGDNCERDAVEAAFWFERSASAGFVPSQLQLGSMYYEGVGVPQRLAEAAAWFRLAAQAGDGQAQFRIASMLWRGEGVASDRAAALDWYRKAAQSGQPDAQVFIESQMPQNSARREGHGESPPPAPPSSPASRSVADSRVEAESVRLVIWDLDDTFWRGTLAEGGIEAYIQKNHDMVVALAERGIMSSICSCNDNGAVRGVLEERGLWQYFIFPSIDWTPKRQRIAAIIEAAQLRPPTVLFVDDNPLHRAAVAAAVPGIQIASPAFLAGMLDDRRFTGKDDRKLSRLAQYKLLETRQVERQATQGGDEEFLRSADIRVIIDTDIAANIDRAIELINRTNQLNFTKRRLPEAPELARAQLRRELSPFYSHACLVRVIDKYGDYGFCGYYRLEGDTLVDYCFSCRILGMGVESWLYERLGRPQVTVAGEVLTDLTQRRRVDWVTLSTNEGSVVAVAERVIPEVRLRGGCELDALAHYFRLVAKAVRSETNRSRAPLFVRMDTAVQLVPALDGSAPSFRDAALRMGFAADDFESQFLAPAAAGSILVYSPWADIYQGVYWHKTEGFRIPVNVHIHSDLTRISDQDLAAAFEDLKLDEAQRAKIISIVETLRSEYRYEFHTPLRIALDIIRRVFERIPAGAQLCFILPHEWYKEGDKLLPRAVKYNQAVRQLASRYSAVTLVSMNDVVHDEGEMQDSFDHFDRVVYFRLYQKIMEAMGVGQVFSSPAVAVS
jgi:FkbH-like protein